MRGTTRLVLEWQQFGEADIASGRRLYEANCAACHGKEADGKGESAEAFNIPTRPSNLVAPIVDPWRTTLFNTFSGG